MYFFIIANMASFYLYPRRSYRDLHAYNYLVTLFVIVTVATQHSIWTAGYILDRASRQSNGKTTQYESVLVLMR